MDIKAAKYSIIRPALSRVGLSGDAAVNLVAGIGLVESAYKTRIQIDGPALGFWQMEPTTHDDCWVNFLDYRPFLARLVLRVAGVQKPSSDLLLTNDLYAALMCRIRLYRSPVPLPSATDAMGLCAYWKSVYNSELGAGQVDVARIALFQEAINI